jgi:hypothetical protein
MWGAYGRRRVEGVNGDARRDRRRVGHDRCELGEQAGGCGRGLLRHELVRKLQCFISVHRRSP